MVSTQRLIPKEGFPLAAPIRLAQHADWRGSDGFPWHPLPGFSLVDEAGVIRDKLFKPHLAVRDGVESILGSFLGRAEPGQGEPIGALTEDDGIS